MSDARRHAPAAHRDRQWDVSLAVAVGGVIGAEARYGLSVAMAAPPASFPWSTVSINVIGCFGLGLLMALLGQLTAPHRLLRPLVGIGVFGGFTTFSTFAVDTERLIEHHRAGLAGLYVLCTVVTAAVALLVATVAAQAAGRYASRRRMLRAESTRAEATRAESTRAEATRARRRASGAGAASRTRDPRRNRPGTERKDADA